MPQNQPQPLLSRRRARHVCVQCHDHKLRCDLEIRVGNGLESCSNCIETASFCQQRPSKRSKRRINGSEDSSGALPSHEHPYPAIQPVPRHHPTRAENEVAQQLPQQLSTQQGTLARHHSSSFSGSLPRHQSAVTPPFPTPSTEQQRTLLPTTVAAPPSPDSRPSEDPPTVSSSTAIGYLGDSGILSIFEQDARKIATSNQGGNVPSPVPGTDLPPLELQQSFAETYFDYCWPWCPVLDKATFWDSLEISPSALLINALSLLGSRIWPPIIQHATAGEYYSRAKMLFYTDQENNPIVCLQAIMLFYWWAPRGPSIVHKDAAWWWTGLAIKYAQQMGLHREPKNAQDVGGEAMQSLRRRIWWTLFARERLTALCQSRPCTIHPEDCNVREPSIEDFAPSEHSRAEIFIYWVRLCGIVGRVGQHLRRRTEQTCFPTLLAKELIEWVHSLPEHLNLPIASNRTRKFDRDVHKLHLPYLTTVTILHMNFSSQHPLQPLPEAYTAAILSASCVARIFKDFMARGQIRFLGAIACWYVGVAIVALLHTQRLQRLAESGAEDIRILRLALNELANLWPSAALFVRGFERLRAFEKLGGAGLESDRLNTQAQQMTDNAMSPVLSDLSPIHGIDWQSYFPYITIQTSGLAGILLVEHQTELLEGISWLEDPTVQLQNFFDPSDTFPGAYIESVLVG